MENDRLSKKESVIRIIDANLNRCAEGLRVIEETARFYIGDPDLVRKVKDLRHEVRRSASDILRPAMLARDATGDPGASFSTDSENRRASILSILRANFLRAEESLRVLEEFGKLAGPSAAELFKAFRFRVYSIEKSFLACSGGGGWIPLAPFLYLFVDRAYVAKGDAGRTAAALARGGADMIQYRAKNLPSGEMLDDINAMVEALAGSGVPLIVNDFPELAVRAGASGAHIGSGDMDPEEARDMIGPGRILGLTIDTLEQLENAPLYAADYIAAGPVYATATKPELKVAGTGFISKMRDATALPLVAIGGIDASNAEEVLDAGADGLAVISAVLKGDIAKNCFTFREIIDRKIEGSKERL